jgi:hypothetical protein
MIKDAKTITEELGNFANTFLPEYHGFSAGLSSQHRTLQQTIMRLFIRWLEDLAELPEDRHDARNEASVRFAKSVMQNVPEEDRWLPYI